MYDYECNTGWFSIADDAIRAMKMIDPFIKVYDVKEKFGLLEIYTSSTDERISEIISHVRDQSASICEVCGSGAKIRDIGQWAKTLCEECYERISNVSTDT